MSNMGRRKNNFSFIFFFSICTLILLGCSNQNELQSEKKLETPPKTDEEKVLKPEKMIKHPIIVPEGEFVRLVGLIDDKYAIYISNYEEGSGIYRYDLFSGESELIFKSVAPIVNALLSASGKQLAIHASPTTYEASLTIVDLFGKEIWKSSFPSFELTWEWNPYDDREIFVTSFNEDWTYKSYLINTSVEEMKEVDSPQPFVKWANKDEIIFIDWENENQGFFAPLVSYNLKTGEQKLLLERIFQFSIYDDRVITITSNQEDSSLAEYEFYDKQFSSLASIKVPQLTRFSDWLVPYFDYIEKEDRFYLFTPLRSAEADSYQDGFQFISFDVDKNQQTVVMEGMENEPITCSASGDTCLYGYRFEKLLLPKEKKIIPLFLE